MVKKSHTRREGCLWEGAGEESMIMMVGQVQVHNEQRKTQTWSLWVTDSTSTGALMLAKVSTFTQVRPPWIFVLSLRGALGMIVFHVWPIPSVQWGMNTLVTNIGFPASNFAGRLAVFKFLKITAWMTWSYFHDTRLSSISD